MKKILTAVLVLLTTLSFSQVYQFEKINHYGIDEDGNKFNDFETVFYKVSESEETIPDSIKGKKFYYMSKTSDDLRNYIISNIDTSNFYKPANADEVKPFNDLDSISKLEDDAFNWSKVDYQDKFLLIDFDNCDSCQFNLAKELIDYNLDEIKSIKNISNIKVITIFKKRKGLLSLVGVKRIELNTIVLIESTYKTTRDHGYTLKFDRHDPITNYEVYGFQPGRIIFMAILWPFRAFSK